MNYEIEIDLPPKVAAKHVPVAVRHAAAGDWYLYGNCQVARWEGGESSGLYVILVPRVEWPAWCSADWIAKDADGDIWATIGERPVWNGDDGEWGCDIAGWRLAKEVHADLYAAFKDVPPHLSLIENPKRIKSDSTS